MSDQPPPTAGRRRSNKTNNNKRQRSTDNPLSAARGKKKAESLWHRKSGAGYHLFVEFYAKHLAAVCVSSSSSSSGILEYQGQHDNNKETSDSRTTNSPGEQQTSSLTRKSLSGQTPGQGLSRAAKRRKKKKGISVTEEHNNTTTKTKAAIGDESEAHKKSHTNQDLWKAFQEKFRHDSLGSDPSFRSFLVALSNPLPLTFRLRQGSLDSKVQRHKIHQEITFKFGSLVESVPFDEAIYQAKKSATILSKDTLSRTAPELKEFLIAQTQQGILARQELGSMLPVLALAKGGWIKSGSRVLDLCASPGSKTLQALEIVGSSGRIKANDVNESRLNALKEASARSGMPHVDRIKYTMHDASKYPIPQRLFDAIICDVPCSGDGTIRKHAHILPGWTPNTSNALHALQVSILQRAIQCVKVGGIVSYSTCSLNPVEDEAVVCAALISNLNDEKTGVKVKLEKWPAMEGFRARPGVKSWLVADYDPQQNGVNANDNENEEPTLRWHGSYEDAVKNGMKDACQTMWPREDCPDDIARCMRLFPQDHDTGGFFVALIKRLQ